MLEEILCHDIPNAIERSAYASQPAARLDNDSPSTTIYLRRQSLVNIFFDAGWLVACIFPDYSDFEPHLLADRLRLSSTWINSARFDPEHLDASPVQSARKQDDEDRDGPPVSWNLTWIMSLASED